MKKTPNSAQNNITNERLKKLNKIKSLAGKLHFDFNLEELKQADIARQKRLDNSQK